MYLHLFLWLGEVLQLQTLDNLSIICISLNPFVRYEHWNRKTSCWRLKLRPWKARTKEHQDSGSFMRLSWRNSAERLNKWQNGGWEKDDVCSHEPVTCQNHSDLMRAQLWVIVSLCGHFHLSVGCRLSLINSLTSLSLQDLSLAAKEALLTQLETFKSKYDEALAARKQTELEIEVLRPVRQKWSLLRNENRVGG